MKKMHPHRQDTGQAGYTILELLIAVAVLAVTAQAFLVFMRTTTKASVQTRNQAVAMEHAIQMLEELRGVVLNDNADIKVLDNDYYNDGRVTNTASTSYGTPNYKYTLTTKTDVTQPSGNPAPDFATGSNALSANPITQKGYTFVRHVDIQPDAKDKNMRNIHVRIWLAAANSGSNAPTTPMPANPKAAPIAEVFGTVRSLVVGAVPSQVIDLYLIALENVPGWWSRTSNLFPLMNSVIVSLQARNPGLVIRSHWIKRMSYGRDLEYTPETNAANYTTASAGTFSKTYVYPGKIIYDDGIDYYYLNSWWEGRVNIDGTLNNTTYNYPIADQWNNAMRYPDELRFYNLQKVLAKNNGAAEPEPSLRLLLEGMAQGSNSYRNAIIMNLHGEMLPGVPLRNYSDAAKDPKYYIDSRGTTRAWRAVTHPEQLMYPSGSNIRLGVYAYDMDAWKFANGTSTATAYEDDLVEAVTLFVPGATLSNLAQVDRMQGNSRNYYKWGTMPGTWSTYTNGTYTAYLDGVSPTTSRWYADRYTPPGRSAGLRIVLQGVTPTTHAFAGAWYP